MVYHYYIPDKILNVGLPVSKCHLSSQSDETQWMFGEILLLKYVSSSCRFNLHFYLYGLSLLYSG